jgi:hypothetical protein
MAVTLIQTADIFDQVFDLVIERPDLIVLGLPWGKKFNGAFHSSVTYNLIAGAPCPGTHRSRRGEQKLKLRAVQQPRRSPPWLDLLSPAASKAAPTGAAFAVSGLQVRCWPASPAGSKSGKGKKVPFQSPGSCRESVIAS